MEILGLVWIPDTILGVITIAIALYLYGTWPFSTLPNLGYKGPKTSIFVGNLDKMFTFTNFFGYWDLTGKELYGKIYYLYEGRQPTIVSFDTDFLKQVEVKEFSSFMDRRILMLRGALKHSVFDLDGAAWKRVRNLQSPFFTSGKLKRNMKCLNFCVNNLKSALDKHAENSEPCEVKGVTAAYTLEAIASTVFGLEIDSQNQPNHPLLVSCKKIMTVTKRMIAVFSFGLVFPFFLELLDKLGVDSFPSGSLEVLTKVTHMAIEERKKNKQDRPDFIQAMIKAHEIELDHEVKQELNEDIIDRSKGMTDDEIVGQAAIFFLAGYDTVSTTASFLMFCLANDQDWQNKVYEEIQEVFGDEDVTYDKLKDTTILDMCMNESQRLYPALFRVDRRCLQDTTINGYFIPKDTLVTIPIYGLHHDPEIWKDPETFDPERFIPENKKNIDPYAFQPFGLGPRGCIGMRLAQIEVKMAVIMTVKNYRLTVSDKTQLPIGLEPGFFPKVQGGLWLNFEKRE